MINGIDQSLPACKNVVPAGMMRDGERISENEEPDDSVPSLLCTQPLPPSNPSVMTHVLLNPSPDRHLAMVLEMSPFLNRQMDS